MSRFIRSIQTGAARADERNDCTVRALANTLDINYDHAHAALSKHGRKHGKGCSHKVWHKAYTEQGLTLVRLYGTTQRARLLSKNLGMPTEKGTTLATLLKTIGKGRFAVMITGHALCVIDGQIIDKFATLANKSVFAVYRA
jgi:hypothetical protein